MNKTNSQKDGRTLSAHQSKASKQRNARTNSLQNKNKEKNRLWHDINQKLTVTVGINLVKNIVKKK